MIARLQCDRCSAVRQVEPGKTIEQLRTQLRRVGWLCTKSGGREVDVCPGCRP